MRDVSVNEGRTVLFVSHNMNAIRTLCTQCLIMEQGKIIMNDEINNVINYYEKTNENNEFWKGIDGDNSLKVLQTTIYAEDSSEIIKNYSTIKIAIEFEAFEDFSDLVIGATIRSIYGYPIATALYNDYNDFTQVDKGKYEVVFSIPPFTLAQGEYKVDFNISVPYIRKINSESVGLSFTVVADKHLGNKFFAENNASLNSIVRPNWFQSIKKIK